MLFNIVSGDLKMFFFEYFIRLLRVCAEPAVHAKVSKLNLLFLKFNILMFFLLSIYLSFI